MYVFTMQRKLTCVLSIYMFTNVILYMGWVSQYICNLCEQNYYVRHARQVHRTVFLASERHVYLIRYFCRYITLKATRSSLCHSKTWQSDLHWEKCSTNVMPLRQSTPKRHFSWTAPSVYQSHTGRNIFKRETIGKYTWWFLLKIIKEMPKCKLWLRQSICFCAWSRWLKQFPEIIFTESFFVW